MWSPCLSTTWPKWPASFFFLCSLFIARPAHADPISQIELQEARATANQVIDALTHRERLRLLALISQTEGLSCTDTPYDFERIQKDLENSESILYIGLFNTAAFRTKCGSEYPKNYPALAEADFYSGPGLIIELEQHGANVIKVKVDSPRNSEADRWFYLLHEAGGWKVAGGSFIIGRCACGG